MRPWALTVIFPIVMAIGQQFAFHVYISYIYTFHAYYPINQPVAMATGLGDKYNYIIVCIGLNLTPHSSCNLINCLHFVFVIQLCSYYTSRVST